MQDRRPGDVASVWHRQNQRGWLVILPAEDFLSLFKAAVPKESE